MLFRFNIHVWQKPIYHDWIITFREYSRFDKAILIKYKQVKTWQLTRSKVISVSKESVKIRGLSILKLTQSLSATTRSFEKR